MKHNIKITALLLSMFVLTQFIGLFVVSHYSPVRVVNGEIQNVTAPELPYGLETPEVKTESEYRALFYGILIAFVIAISIMFLLTKFNLSLVLKIWFFIVITMALSIFFNAIIQSFSPCFRYSEILAVVFALPLAFIKLFKRNFVVHNLTELVIYPGISSVFVPILNFWTIAILLILISIYDIWAVWHSGIMQKMAKYQINKLNIFSGFFVPYLSKTLRMKLKKMRMKAKKTGKKKGIKVNIAILGGGDIIFPIITAGVMMKTAAVRLPFDLPAFAGGIIPAISVIIGATMGLTYLFMLSEKKKFYPAMPFITGGIFIAIIFNYLLNIIF